MEWENGDARGFTPWILKKMKKANGVFTLAETET